MPNWTDERGRSSFNKLDCKRCLKEFEADDHGEVPIHECLDGWYRSESSGGIWHYPVKVKRSEVCSTCNGQCCHLDMREGTTRYAQTMPHGKGVHWCKHCEDGTTGDLK